MLIAKNKYFLLSAIFIIGLALRFYMLGSNPPSLNWDEASTGYNAYSILLTGKDEYGNFLPLSIRSFDDYKPALYTYLTVPSVAIFGLTDFAVRFPSAVLGTLTILALYFLVAEFTSLKSKEEKSNLEKFKQPIALMTALLFAVSPWSLQFSRAAYEGNIGLFFYISGLLFFLKSFKKRWNLLISAIFFSAGMYSYHSFRLIIPLTLIILATLYLKEIITNKKITVFSIIIFAFLSIPVFSNFLFSNQGSGSRLSMVTVFGNPAVLEASIRRLEYDLHIGNFAGMILDNRRAVYARVFADGYLAHFDPGFLFIDGDSGRQHHAVDMGMLYFIALPFILIGIFALIRKLDKKRLILIFGLFLTAPIPSAIATGAPHPVRAIVMAPFFDIFAAVGLVMFTQMIPNIRLSSPINRSKILNVNLKYLTLALCILFLVFNFLYYLNQYYVHTPREYAEAWQYGYKKAFEVAKSKEKEVDTIVMTAKYDQPYIFYLYYNKIDPVWYQENWNFTGNGIMPRFERKIGMYEFRFIKLGDELRIPNKLIIGSPDEIHQNAKLPKGGRKLGNIYYPDGSLVFRIIQTRYVPKN